MSNQRKDIFVTVMKKRYKNLKNNRIPKKNKEPIEIVAERLAQILVSQIEFNKNEDKH